MVKKSKAELELAEFDVVFKALAHATRRHILVVLHARGGQMNAGDIVNRFNYKWPTITRHLQLLEKAGLITVQKVSREQLYQLRADRMKEVVGRWLNWF